MNRARPLLAALIAVASSPAALGPRAAHAHGTAPEAGTLGDLRARYNPVLYRGLELMRSHEPGVADRHVVGDSTDASGMRWTKCTNLALDLIATLVAEERGLVPAAEARDHVRDVLAVLGGLQTYHGIFPEIVLLDGELRPEIKDGRIRYSSIDSAWVTMALTLVRARYEARPAGARELGARAEAMLAAQDYTLFVGRDGLLGAGFWVDARTLGIAERFPFSYGDRNSEARPLVLALVGLGKLPSTAFDDMRATWTVKESVPVIAGWRSSAFVEMTGQLWLDEMALAPLSLGRSHANYVEATTRVARRLGHTVWGYAPACDPDRGYSEYGLDRAELVSPYAASLLAMTGDPRAVANLERILRGLPQDGRPLPDGLDPVTGRGVCDVARTLDQSLLFLSLNADVVRALAGRTSWYAFAERRTRALDETDQPPHETRTTPRADAKHARATEEPGLLGVVAAARRTDEELGRSTDLARSELRLASTTAARGWAELSPELAFAVRHAFDASLFDPPWRLVVQAQIAQSLEKVWTARAASDARAAAEALVRQKERGAAAHGLEAYFALFAAERRVSQLGEHRQSLAALASGLSGGAARGTVDDLVLLRSRLSAIDAAIADAEAARSLALERLRALTGGALAGSGLDSHLDLAAVLALLEDVARDAEDGGEAEAVAAIAQQTSLLSRARSRAPYVPELRAGVFVDIPRVDVPRTVTTPTTLERWNVDGVNGSLSLAFDVRPAYDREREAVTRALENRTSRLELVRETRAARLSEARARLRAGAAAWSVHPESVAEALYRDAGERLRRGELEIGAVIAASRVLVSTRDDAERTFGAAVSAGVALAVLGERPLDEVPHEGRHGGLHEGFHDGFHDALARPGGDVQAVSAPTLSPGDAEAAEVRALVSAPAVRAADAEAARAEAEAEHARRDSWHVGLEASVLYPFYARPGATAAQTLGPVVPIGPVAFGTERFREPALLGRLSLELKGNREALEAAQAEAELRAAEGELARKHHLAEQAGARLDLAFARAAADAASERARLGADQLRLAQQMQAQGLSDEKSLVQRAELQADAARVKWLGAEEAVKQTTVRANRVLGRAVDSPLSVDETPDQLMNWLRQTQYPSHGLVGYRSELGTRIAGLEERLAQCRLAALRNPPRAIDLTLQATEQLRGYGHSIGLALGLRLDPARNRAQIVEAARLAGESEGRVSGEAEQIAVERRVARAELEAAQRLQALAEQSREALAAILGELTKNQDALPELNGSAKARARGTIEAQLRNAELASLEASARRARAELGVLEWDAPRSTPPPSADGVDVIDRLVATDPELAAASGAARDVGLEAERAHGPLAGLHLAGPFAGASYSVTRPAVPPSSTVTTRDADGFVSAGIAANLTESLAFMATPEHERATERSLAAARARAETRALAGLGQLWSLRERARGAARIGAERRRRLDDLAVPRYHAAQISAESLADAAVSAADATAELARAEGAEGQARAALAARGVVVTDELLDELARRASPESVAQAQAALTLSEERERLPGSGAELGAARARAAAAESDARAAYAGVIGPVTLLLELDPQRRRATVATAGAPSLTQDARELTWVSSLFVPARPKALAEGAEAAARADVRRAEVAATALAIRTSFAETRLQLSSAGEIWRAAERARRDASLAFAEIDRRYRQGLVGADADTHAEAEDDLFAAEGRVAAARGVLTTLLAPMLPR